VGGGGQEYEGSRGDSRGRPKSTKATEGRSEEARRGGKPKGNGEKKRGNPQTGRENTWRKKSVRFFLEGKGSIETEGESQLVQGESRKR